MKAFLASALVLLCLTACTPEKRSPDAIREDTARVTKEATQDAKAVAQGVVQGLREKGPINVNKASADDLKSLPGIDDAAAQRIIDDRPYNDASEMVKKGAITKHEYNQIAGKVTAK